MIVVNKNLTKHFHSSEFKCQHCGAIYIQEELVNKLEKLIELLGASKCIISSGYRCATYDKKIGGFIGKHAQGLAADCCFYDSKGNIIPSKNVICTAWDNKLFNGIAKINNNYVHLDNRVGSTYYGDETKSNNSCWTDPYVYFGVTRTGSSSAVNVYYRVKTKNGWLGEVKNLEDYAGSGNNPIIGLVMKVDRGSIKYRVHVKGGNWLGWITGYDINNGKTGYAGNNREIDAIQVYYNTPNNIRPYKKAKYKVNNYSWQYDTNTNNKQDGYAGAIGVAATKFQIVIE